MQRLTFALDDETARVVHEVADSRDEPLSAILRRGLRRELGWLGYLADEEIADLLKELPGGGPE